MPFGFPPERAFSFAGIPMQRIVAANWIFETGYFGSKIVGADDSTFYNIPQPGPGPLALRRPNPNLSGFQLIHWGGYSNYHALSLRMERHLAVDKKRH